MQIQKLLLIIFLGTMLQPAAHAQDGFNTGAHVSTSFQLITHRDKGTKIWSSESGYGFSAGVPFRFGYAEDRSFVTGLDYEYMAFDNRINGNLVTSMRMQSLHVPLQFNFKLVSTLFWSTGGGINYQFRAQVFNYGNNISISNNTNPFQPYVSLGIGSLSQRGNGLFELGIQTRYHFVDMWKKSYPLYDAVSSKVLSFDLVMRFYL